MTYKFLEKRGNEVFFTGYKLEIFLPTLYFDEEIAIENGMSISTLGIFVFKYYDKESSKGEYFQFNLAETIEFTFSDQRTEELAINKDIPLDKYKIFTLYKEDIFIKSVKLAKNFKNTESFVNLHNKAKIPSTVKYEDIIKLYMENMFSNNANLKVPSAILEMNIGELARDKNDINIPFRKVIGANKNVSQLDYIQVSIKSLAMINSTFTAITSEDINQAIQSAITKSRTNGLELETPIEKTIKY